MKRFNSVVLALTAGCAFAISSYATDYSDTILNYDTWASVTRTSGTPGGGGETPWYAASTSTLSVPAAGDMQGVITSSGAWWSFFAAAGSPVTLNDANDELKITLVFAPSSVAGQNTSQAFNIAVAQSPVQKTVDGSPTNQLYAGYSTFMNMGKPLGGTTPFALKEWTSATAGSLLGTAGNWGANGVQSGTLAGTGTSGNTGFANGTSYTFVMTLTRNLSGGLDITSTMSGGSLNGTGSETVSYTDTTPNSFSYDTFEVRPSASSTSAAQFDFSLFEVEYIVPEPATLTLVGLGMLGLVLARRMRR